MIIQYALIALMLGVLLYFLGNRNSLRVRAWKRFALAAFVLLGVVAVISPDYTNRLAHAIGIGRGADLLLYLTVVAFVFVSLNAYLKFRDLEYRLAELARSQALLEVELRALQAIPRDSTSVRDDA